MTGPFIGFVYFMGSGARVMTVKGKKWCVFLRKESLYRVKIPWPAPRVLSRALSELAGWVNSWEKASGVR